jgi:hypothetical protein
MSNSSAISLRDAATLFVVQDVLRSVAHYRDVLERDNVAIHLQAASETKRQPGQGAINVFVTGVDALYQELKSRGARTTEEPAIARTACGTSTSLTWTATSFASGSQRPADTRR